MDSSPAGLSLYLSSASCASVCHLTKADGDQSARTVSEPRRSSYPDGAVSPYKSLAKPAIVAVGLEGRRLVAHIPLADHSAAGAVCASMRSVVVECER
jgi:hypothetical protein